MSHSPPTDDLAALTDDDFWAQYHAAAGARDHRVWAACGREFARPYDIAGTNPRVPLEEYHARLGSTVYHLWETAQTRYWGLPNGLPNPPLRETPPTPDEPRRYGRGIVDASPNVVWVGGPEFSAEVLAVTGRVVVLLCAAWSAPDRMLLMWLKEHAVDWPGVKFAAINIDECADVAVRFDYQTMPTTLALEGGKPVGRSNGCRDTTGAGGHERSMN